MRYALPFDSRGEDVPGNEKPDGEVQYGNRSSRRDRGRNRPAWQPIKSHRTETLAASAVAIELHAARGGVDALTAQLESSRERIADLEARVDIDPLTDVLNRRGFERELKRSLAYVNATAPARR